jgi:hypothetical protein
LGNFFFNRSRYLISLSLILLSSASHSQRAWSQTLYSPMFLSLLLPHFRKYSLPIFFVHILYIHNYFFFPTP